MIKFKICNNFYKIFNYKLIKEKLFNILQNYV
jgi:hypothetical protein